MCGVWERKSFRRLVTNRKWIIARKKYDGIGKWNEIDRIKERTKECQ